MSLYAEVILDTEARLGDRIWETLEVIFDTTFEYWIPLSCQSIRANEGLHGHVALVEVLTTSFQNCLDKSDEALAQLEALAVVDALHYLRRYLREMERSHISETSSRIILSLKTPLILLCDVASPIGRDAIFDMRYIMTYGRGWRFDLLFAAANQWKTYMDVFVKDLKLLAIDQCDYLITCVLYRGITVWGDRYKSSESWANDLRSRFRDERGFRSTDLPTLMRWTQSRSDILWERVAAQTFSLCPMLNVDEFQNEQLLPAWAGLRTISWLDTTPDLAFWKISFEIIVNCMGYGASSLETFGRECVSLILGHYSLIWPFSLTVYKLEAVRTQLPAIWVPDVMGSAIRIQLQNMLEEYMRFGPCRIEDEAYRTMRNLIAMLEPPPSADDLPATNDSQSCRTELWDLVIRSAHFGHALDKVELEEALKEYSPCKEVQKDTQSAPVAAKIHTKIANRVITGLSPLSALNTRSPVSSDPLERSGSPLARWWHRHRRARSGA